MRRIRAPRVNRRRIAAIAALIVVFVLAPILHPLTMAARTATAAPAMVASDAMASESHCSSDAQHDDAEPQSDTCRNCCVCALAVIVALPFAIAAQAEAPPFATPALPLVSTPLPLPAEPPRA